MFDLFASFHSQVSTSEEFRKGPHSTAVPDSLAVDGKLSPINVGINLSDTSSGYNSSSFSPSSYLNSVPRSHSVYKIEFPSFNRNMNRKVAAEKPARIKYLKDSITNILDQIDTRVTFLRETAFELEEEKRKLLGVLNSLVSTQDLSLISESNFFFNLIGTLSTNYYRVAS